MAFQASAENKAIFDRPFYAPDRGSPYSYVKSACEAQSAPNRDGACLAGVAIRHMGNGHFAMFSFPVRGKSVESSPV